MHYFSTGVALLVVVAIVAIGVGYLSAPRSMVAGFGLPLPEDGPNVAWWLRLKGVRDVVSGLVVLAALILDGHRVLGIALLIEALIPIGDMSVVLAGRGRPATALGVHGATAAAMVAAGIPLVLGTA